MGLNLRAGDLVEVLSEDEILATLDQTGCVDGLPFMPEMLAFCGKRIRVSKRADKACDTINYSGSRRLYDTVHLEGLRCDGAAHGGCQAMCPLYWKEAWLKRANGRTPPARKRNAPQTESSAPIQCDRELLAALTMRASEPESQQVRYRCQATELLSATSPMAWWDVRQYIRDLTTRNIRIRDFLRVTAFRLFQKVIHLPRYRGYALTLRAYDRFQSWRGGRPYPRTAGTLKKTPRRTLDLAPGELVRIKSQDEILETVNERGRNRGLSFDPEMTRYCDSERRVLARVEQIIDESTGKMIELSSDCIILDGVTCQAECSHKRIFCPRALYPFWREIWLERINGRDGATPSLPRDSNG